jgi:hypothetical protein
VLVSSDDGASFKLARSNDRCRLPRCSPPANGVVVGGPRGVAAQRCSNPHPETDMHAAPRRIGPPWAASTASTPDRLAPRAAGLQQPARRDRVCAVLTLVLGLLAATRLSLSASFEKMIPRSHPYIQNYLENRSELRGLGNCAAHRGREPEGDIYDPTYQTRSSRSTTRSS